MEEQSQGEPHQTAEQHSEDALQCVRPHWLSHLLQQDDHQSSKGTSCGGGDAQDCADCDGEYHPDAKIDQLIEGERETEKPDQSPGYIRLDPGNRQTDRAVPVGSKHEQEADNGPGEVVLGKGFVEPITDYGAKEALDDVQQENWVEQCSFHGRQYEEAFALLSRNCEYHGSFTSSIIQDILILDFRFSEQGGPCELYTKTYRTNHSAFCSFVSHRIGHWASPSGEVYSIALFLFRYSLPYL